MSAIFQSRTFKLLFISVVLSLISWGINFIIPNNWATSTFIYQIAYFFVFTLGIIFSLSRIAERKPKKFISSFLLATSAKLLTNILIVIILAFSLKAQAKGILIHFIAYYLIYTILEVYFVNKATRKKVE